MKVFNNIKFSSQLLSSAKEAQAVILSQILILILALLIMSL